MKRTLRGLWVAVPWLISMGCGGNHATLTRVVPATTCAAGGVTVGSGADSNDNGVLDDGEVTATNDVCNGAQMTGMAGKTGFNTVVATTDLASGDPNCANGGTQIDIGLDDGANGGTAGDGVLQPGEVQSTKYVCNGGPPDSRQPMDPPAGPGARFKIDTSGGDAAIYFAGSAGSIDAHMQYGTNGGHIKVFATGSVDSQFTLPSLTFHAGDVPFVVSDDTVLNVYPNATPAGIASGDPYFTVDGSNKIYKNDAGTPVVVTSLDVQAGVTLTLGANDGAGSCLADFSDDVRNAGTIVTPFNGSSTVTHAQVTITTDSNFFGLAGSMIITAGESDTDPGNGAYLAIGAGANLVNQGDLDTSGADGFNYGGGAGGIYLSSGAGAIYNTGKLTAKGGSSLLDNSGSGGGGGYVQFYAGYRGLYNSGAITTDGGDGLYNGGFGGQMFINVNYGPLTLAGPMSLHGGTCNAADCNGGGGGQLYAQSFNGPTTVTGNILTYGGNGKGVSFGGSGGAVYFYNYASNYSGPGGSGSWYTPTGSMRFWSSIITKGGNGGWGGQGGQFYVYLDPESQPQGQEIAFYGLSSVSAAGGKSVNYGGGSGSNITYQIDSSAYFADYSYRGPGGSVLNYVPLDTHGGDGRYGSSAGQIYLSTQTDNYYGNNYEMAINRATLDGHGGASDGPNIGGGSASNVYLIGVSGVDNSGAIVSTGGAASGVNAQGADGGYVYFGVDNAACKNSGPIDVSGGASFGPLGQGGGGGYVGQYGLPVDNSSDIVANGGDGDFAGSGGYIELVTPGSSSSTNTGTFSVAAGFGFVANGQKGTAYMDGVNVTP